MTSIKIDIREFTIPAGQDTVSFPLDVSGVQPTSSGWAWYRPRPTWFEPRTLPSLSELPDLSIHLLCVQGDEYFCILPVSSSDALAHLRRNDVSASAEDSPPLLVNVRSATHEDGKVAVVIVRTPDTTKVSSLPGVAVSQARQWLAPGKIYKDREPSIFDGLGFCTWSSLGEGNRPTEKTLRKLVDHLVTAEVPVQAFIIDDGWQNHRTFFEKTTAGVLRRRGLWDFNAHPDIGPGGLAAAVGMIKQKLSVLPVGQTEVGVWVALTGGYWEGIHPESPLISRYGCKSYTATLDWWSGVPNETYDVPFLINGRSQYFLPPPETALVFWKRYFQSLVEAGVTFVKVDNQAAVSSLCGVEGAIEARQLWRAMFTAAQEAFGSTRVIHCMAHGENMWTGEQGLGYASTGERLIWRNSDDFGLARSRGHQNHFFTNIFNTLISNSLCVIPDADMFMTAAQHPHSHALLRALFPGPMVLSDKPGEHDRSLLTRLIALDKSGVVRVLKTTTAPEPLARRMLDMTICDDSDGTGLWAAVRSPHATLMGVWNVHGAERPCRVVDKITVDDIEDALGHVLSQHHTVVRVNVDSPGIHSATMLRPEQRGELGGIELDQLCAAAFWITPMYNVGAGPVTVLGLIDAYAGPMGINSVDHTINRVDVVVKYAGTLGLIVAAPLRPAATALVDGRPEVVRASKLPRLDGREQNLFLLRIRVCGDGMIGSDAGDEVGDGWMVRISIE